MGFWPGIVVIVVLFAIFGDIMLKAGLFNYTGSADSAKIVAASLALVGALLGSLVSAIGLLLKHSIDRRNLDLKEQAERRLEIEAQRNADLQVESEKRLKLETAIQAVRLISTDSGELAPEVQRAGALFTLTGLGRYELATNLAWQMLITDNLDPGSFTSVLNRVLIGGNQHEKEEAAAMLYYHADKLFLPDGMFTFPDCLMSWDISLPNYVRRVGALALGRLITKVPVAEWEIGVAHTIIAALALGWCEESDENIKNEVGAILNRIVKVFPQKRDLIHYRCRIDMLKICDEIASVTAIESGTQKLIEEIEAWANRKDLGSSQVN